MARKKEIEGSDKITGRPIRLNRAETSERSKRLVPIGDIHYGAPNCDIEKVQRTLEYCREKNAWIILMGDLFEASTRTSVGAGVYEQNRTPQQQLDDLVEIFEPYKDLILGSHVGNHEFRITQAVGVDIMKIFCKQLGIRFLGYSMNHCLKVGGERYIVYSTHGATGASLRHTKIKKVLDIANHNQSDLYLYAHTHSIDTKTDEYSSYDSKNKVMVKHKRYFCLTGSFLNYEGSYAEMKNLHPEKTGVIKVALFGDKHDIHVST